MSEIIFITLDIAIYSIKYRRSGHIMYKFLKLGYVLQRGKLLQITFRVQPQIVQFKINIILRDSIEETLNFVLYTNKNLVHLITIDLILHRTKTLFLLR